MISFDEGNSFNKNNNNQDLMESEYEMENSIISEEYDEDNKIMLSQMMYEGSKQKIKKNEMLNKLSTNQKVLLQDSSSSDYYTFFKVLMVYLDITENLYQLFENTKNKTLLYLLTLIVNRIEAWNKSIINCLKKSKAYFIDGKKK